MDRTRVYSKTEKGEEEIATRRHGLALLLRRVLILVDGVSAVNKLLEKGEGLPDIAGSLEELEREEYIVAARGKSSRSIKEELIAEAKRTLGGDAGKVVKKLQKSPDNAEGLRSTVEDCKKLVKLIIDEKKADELGRRCHEILEKR